MVHVTKLAPGSDHPIGRSYPPSSQSQSPGQWGKENASPSEYNHHTPAYGPRPEVGSAADNRDYTGGYTGDNRDYFAYTTPSFSLATAARAEEAEAAEAEAAEAETGKGGAPRSSSPHKAGGRAAAAADNAGGGGGSRRLRPTSRRSTAAAAILAATSPSPVGGCTS
jgi:hypothetical protein